VTSRGTILTFFPWINAPTGRRDELPLDRFQRARPRSVRARNRYLRICGGETPSIPWVGTWSCQEIEPFSRRPRRDERILLLLRAAKREKAVLLLPYVTGGDESDLLQLGTIVLPNSVCCPRGDARSDNGMPRFFRRLAEGVFDEGYVRPPAFELWTFWKMRRRQGIDRPAGVGARLGSRTLCSSSGTACFQKWCQRRPRKQIVSAIC
jgi:hypothetical protein